MNVGEQFLYRFINNETVYAKQYGYIKSTGEERHGYECIRESRITNDLFLDHLVSEITLGVYSTNPDTNTSRWLCWDIDDEQEDELDQLIGWLSCFGIYSIRESRRPGRSGHVWIFLKEPMRTADAFRLLRFGRDMAQLKGEIFPRQPELKPGNPGNLVRLPLGINRKPSANGAWGLFYDCKSPVPEDQIYWFLDQPLNDLDCINKILEQVPNLDPPKEYPAYDGPVTPLLEHFGTDWPFILLPSGEMNGPCPACRSEGHDEAGDNLFLNPTKNKMYCFYGDNRQHSYTRILKALRNIKKPVTIA